jgi:adenylate kinase family enzyme
MDGNHARTLPERLSRADAVIWLDLSTALCLRRVLARIAGSFGRVRPDMAPGCPEKLDLEFLVYVLRFRKAQRPQLAQTLAGYAGTLLVARTPAEAEALL